MIHPDPSVCDTDNLLWCDNCVPATNVAEMHQQNTGLKIIIQMACRTRLHFGTEALLMLPTGTHLSVAFLHTQAYLVAAGQGQERALKLIVLCQGSCRHVICGVAAIHCPLQLLAPAPGLSENGLAPG